jgi:hypothetical protein
MSDSSHQGLPQYFVSTAHGALIDDGRGLTDWQPWGDQHARELGAIFTACGTWADGWRTFTSLPFPSSPTVTCRKCMVAVARVREETLTSTDA